MKKIFLLLALISINVFSQEYKFNYYLRSKVENTTTKYMIVEDNFINSSEKSYFAKVHDAFEKGFQEIEIFDYERGLIHFFKIKNTDDFFDSKKYKYYYSAYLNVDDSIKKEMLEIIYNQKDIDLGTELKKVIIEKFKKKSSKKPEFTINADLKKSEGDIRHLGIVFLTGATFPYIKFEEVENAYISHAILKIKKMEIIFDSEILATNNIVLTVNPKDIKLPKEKPRKTNEILEDILRDQKKE